MRDVFLPDVRYIVTAIALMLAMVCAGWLGRRQVLGVVVLALLSFAWLTVDKDWELTVLVAFNSRFGLTLADFVGYAGALVALIEAALLVRRRGSTRRRRDGGAVRPKPFR